MCTRHSRNSGWRDIAVVIGVLVYIPTNHYTLHFLKQSIGLVIELLARMTASHVGVPAFDTQLWLLISASCKCRLWIVVMMAQWFEFLLPRWKMWIEYPLVPASRPPGHCSHLRIRLSCGNSCFYVSHSLSFK